MSSASANDPENTKESAIKLPRLSAYALNATFRVRAMEMGVEQLPGLGCGSFPVTTQVVTANGLSNGHQDSDALPWRSR